MLQQQVYVINTVLMIIDALCIIAAGYSAYFLRVYQSKGSWSMGTDIFVASVLLVMFLNNYLMGKFQLYSDKRLPSYFGLMWSVFKTMAINFAALSAGIFISRQFDYSRMFLLFFALFSLIYIYGYRIGFLLYFDKISGKQFGSRKIIVVGDRDRWKIVSDLLERQLSWGHEVVGRLTPGSEDDDTDNDNKDSLGSIEDLPTILKDATVDEVIFALDGDRNIDLSKFITYCKRMGVPTRILPSMWKPNDKTFSVEICQEVPFLTVQTDNFNATGLLYKRILDLAGGLTGTLLLFIIYPFVAAMIKLNSKGAVLFKQKRVGKHGRIFNLYKFRSMYDDAEERRKEILNQNEMNGAIFKMKDDPRITTIGRWLRKTSLDEFPQFLNVIRGEMSLVGTRPPMIEEVEKYQLQHLKRLASKPGITGLWQVSGRNKIIDFDKIVELDCKYLENWRFFDDILILFKTVLIVLQRKGAV